MNEGDYNGNDSDLDKVGNENTSPSETGDEKVAKMSRILDIIKTGKIIRPYHLVIVHNAIM